MLTRRDLIASIPATLIPPGTKENQSKEIIVNITIPEKLIEKAVQEMVHQFLNVSITPIQVYPVKTACLENSSITWNTI